MQSTAREHEPIKQPVTPKEGAQIALESACEEIGQKIVALDMGLYGLLLDIPADHPLRSQLEDLAGIAKRGLAIVRKYRDAGSSGEFNFDIDSKGDPCLDIHPHSATSLSKEQ